MVAGEGFALASNPEFLRAVSAAEDFRNPWMTVIASRDPQTVERLRALLSPFGGDMRTFTQPGRGRVRQVRAQHLQRGEDQLLERDVAGRPRDRPRPRPDRRDGREVRRGLDQPAVRHPRRRPLRRCLPAQGHLRLPRLRRLRRSGHAAAARGRRSQRAPGEGGQQRGRGRREQVSRTPIAHDVTSLLLRAGHAAGRARPVPLGVLARPAHPGGALQTRRQRLPHVDQHRGAGLPGRPDHLRDRDPVVAGEQRRRGHPRHRPVGQGLPGDRLPVPGDGRDHRRAGQARRAGEGLERGRRPSWSRWSTPTPSGRRTWRPRCASRSPTPAWAASARGRACTAARACWPG